MNKIIVFFVFAFAAISISAQPKSLKYKEEKQDYFLNILCNPNASLGDMILYGNLNDQNTEFLDYYVYATSDIIGKKCEELNVNFSSSYEKAKATWPVFLELARKRDKIYNTRYAYRGNIFAERLTDEEKYQASIVPLKLEEY